MMKENSVCQRYMYVNSRKYFHSSLNASLSMHSKHNSMVIVVTSLDYIK